MAVVIPNGGKGVEEGRNDIEIVCNVKFKIGEGCVWGEVEVGESEIVKNENGAVVKVEVLKGFNEGISQKFTGRVRERVIVMDKLEMSGRFLKADKVGGCNKRRD